MKCKNCKRLEYRNDGRERYAWCPFIGDNPDLEFERYCGAFKKMTNADRIRNMTDEELAEQILKIDQSEHIKFCQNKPECCECDEEITTDMCKQCILEWLQKEVE